MIKKMTPIKKVSAAVQQQLGVQEVQKAAPKSTDPINFPVFEVPVNSKLLVYVPNHTVVAPDGSQALRMDMPLIHSVTDGTRFYSYRCINGLEDESLGLTGECPLCEGCAEPWEYANLIIEEKCKARGLNPEDTDNTEVKNIRSTAFSDRVLKDATRYYTFPIVVFETVNNEAKQIAKDENGQMQYKVYWYHISESLYEDKWKKALEAMEDEPTHPGGHFFLLNYTYTPKHGEPNKRDSARALAVSARNIKGSEKLREHLDAQTEKWTPEKAMETVITNNLYNTEQLQEVADAVLENTRNLIQLMKAPNAISGESREGFKLEEKPVAPAEDSGEAAPAMDETDLDIDM